MKTDVETKGAAEGTAVRDLREWLARVEAAGELQRLDGAHWDLEIGGIAELNARQADPRVILFDRITGYPAGRRVVVGTLGAPRRIATTLGLGELSRGDDVVRALSGKPLEWQARAAAFPAEEVGDGAVLENVLTGAQVDLSIFPTPRWHEFDGGRYLGTGSAVVTVDPDGGPVNVGTYRIMVLDERTVTVHIIPGKHGRLHFERWFALGKPCPIAVSLGHDPLLFAMAATEVPAGITEYDYAGAVRGEPMRVLRAPVTGLPVPADAEIVVDGWLRPDRTHSEGPFGEWHGYYTGGGELVEPVMEVEAVLHRNDPILLGVPPGRPPCDYSYFRAALKSAMIRDALVQSGVPEVRGVWAHEAGGGRQFVAVSIAQRYDGHARQVGHLVSQLPAAAWMGKWVVVVDEDIDASDLDQIIWAMSTRCEPSEDIDLIKKAWGSRGDPLRRPGDPPFNSRAVLDACKPFHRKDAFPRVASISDELARDLQAKYGALLGW